MRRALTLLALTLGARTLPAQNAPAPSPDDLAARFAYDVRPLLRSHCVKCHGLQKKKGGIDFLDLEDGAAALRERRTWKKALLQVEEKEMPPEGEKPLTGESPRAIVAAFARRAYRRSPSDEEVDRLMALHERGLKRGDAPAAALRLPLKAILLSPHFLFRVEREHPGTQPYRVSGPELATRLSYFLWSTMPDEALAADAEQGKLADPAVLEAQVRRMLLHPKARALTLNFAAQWLQLRKLDHARPSTEFFPSFTNKLKQAMRDEATTFLDKLREEDRSVLELLDCDYAWLNGDLAKHYGIGGVEGKEFRRVALKPENHRGGLLGMGAILALTSHTSRTSPTLRGKWILESIFGTPPPPPPPDAGTLKEQKKGAEPKTFRELMAQHATQPTCTSCHRRIDPLGFALENYDAVGAWRDAQGGKPMDAAGVLP